MKMKGEGASSESMSSFTAKISLRSGRVGKERLPLSVPSARAAI